MHVSRFIVPTILAAVCLAAGVVPALGASTAPSEPERPGRGPSTETSAPQTATGAPAARRVEQVERRSTERTARVETAAESRGVLSERLQQRVRNLAANVSNRMEAAIERLEHIADRLDARLEKQRASGTDTTDAAASLARARTELAAARVTLAEIDAQVARALTSLTPRAEWSQVRSTYTSARTSILNSHAALRESLILAKTSTNREVRASTVSTSSTETR